jgi:PAS domain S-box-containing protein
MLESHINRHWKRIIDTINEGLLVIGPDGTIIAVNHGFEEMTGYTAAEIMGRPCTLLNCDACEKPLADNRQAWCRLFETGSQLKCRCTIMRKDGTCLPVLKNATILRDEESEVLGAVETLTDLSELQKLSQRADRLTRQLDVEQGFAGIVGRTESMQRVFDLIEKAAQGDAPVIIYGESGTGKELVARAIHRLGRRKDNPLVQLNCAALNEALLESELFGHVRGSFTGAYQHRPGRFEIAHGGSLFLDEIGDIPLSVQAKLLRVLENHQFERVGDHRPIRVDVRIITATNKDLRESIRRKGFRADLFFRINVIPIHMPPLRTRREDIPLLINSFVRDLQKRNAKPISHLTRAAMERCMAYDWPGNVRELKSALEYAFVIADEDLIAPEHLPPQIAEPRSTIRSRVDRSGSQKEALVAALRQAGGNQTQAARLLGVNRVTVWNRMKKYGIDLRKIINA